MGWGTSAHSSILELAPTRHFVQLGGAWLHRWPAGDDDNWVGEALVA
jgi:hypothetical protein